MWVERNTEYLGCDKYQGYLVLYVKPTTQDNCLHVKLQVQDKENICEKKNGNKKL